MDRNREPLINLLLYHYFKWSVVSPVLNIMYRSRVYGADQVPNYGPLVVVSNHASDFDPPIVSCCMKRPVAFMAKEELFKIPILKDLIKLYGAYPVNRAIADRNAIRYALSYLKQGWATGVFLQGTRTKDGKITDPKLGAALIAAKAKAPIIPVSLWGTNEIFPEGSKFPKFVPVTIRIGQVIPAPSSSDRDELEAITTKCANIINDLHSLGR